MLLASACLPALFKAVEVNGEHYWDGGYSGNPAIYPLFYKCDCSDTVIVQINPFNIDEVPTTAPDIMNRVNEISFNSTLMREMRSIAFVSKLISQGSVNERNNFKNMHLHMIEAEEVMLSLGRISKYNPDWDFLLHLKDIGRQAAQDWLEAHYDKIEVESSIDIEKMFF
jgi:NTE family protein